MNVYKTIAFSLIFGGLLSSPLVALDIPLSGGGGGGQGGGKIGYVDMERIFQVFPQTKFAREDYVKRLRKKQKDLLEKEKELESIRGRISVLESTLKNFPEAPLQTSTAAAVSGSTVSVPTNQAGSQAVSQMKLDLAKKEAELEDSRKQAAAELESFEKQQSQIILGKLYEALQNLAQEEQISLVIDKSSILYGSATIDLTEKLQQKVRGY